MQPADHADDPPPESEKTKMLRDELYRYFSLELLQERTACAQACGRFNAQLEGISRRGQIELIAQ